MKTLLFDSGPGNDRIVIFSTTRNLKLMCECDNWFADGTFKTSPPLFSQVYIIHGFKENNVIPTVYVLLNSKRKQTYVRVIQELKNIEPGPNPTSVMTDFDTAAYTAF